VKQVESFPANHVVLTGGEPMIMPDIADLCTALKAKGRHITIETAATVFKDVKLDLASLSPKLSNSIPTTRDGGRFARAHDQARLNMEVIQQFIDCSADFQLKFVVCEPGDLDEISQVLDQIRNWKPADVLLMPEGIDETELSARSQWLAEACKERGFRFCPRLHVMLYGNRRGT
jgi:7-carboxy-7-deazaguanine synthase